MSNDMERERFDPCPFCGSDDIDGYGWLGNDGNHGPQCMACGATAESAEKWNRRATPAPAEAQAKVLDDPRLQELFSSAILGALAFGAQGTNPPPDGHWLTQFWEVARAESNVRYRDGWNACHYESKRAAPPTAGAERTHREIVLAVRRGIAAWGDAVGGVEEDYIADEVLKLLAAAPSAPSDQQGGRG